MKYLCKTKNPRVPAVIDVPPAILQRLDDSSTELLRVQQNLAAYLLACCPHMIDYVTLEEEPEDRTCRMCSGSGLYPVGENVLELCTCVKRIGLKHP